MQRDVRWLRDDRCDGCEGEQHLGDRDTFLASLLSLSCWPGKDDGTEKNDLWTYDVGSVRQGIGYDSWRKSEERHDG